MQPQYPNQYPQTQPQPQNPLAQYPQQQFPQQQQQQYPQNFNQPQQFNNNQQNNINNNQPPNFLPQPNVNMNANMQNNNVNINNNMNNNMNNNNVNMQNVLMPNNINFNPNIQQHQISYTGGKLHGYAAIDSVPGVVFRQQVKGYKKGCCENELSYIVCEGDQQGNAKAENTLFKITENNDCCTRCVCPGNCRPFDLKIENLKGEGEIFLKISRPCTYSFLCCDRPHLEVYRVDNLQHTKIGSIRHRYSCCTTYMDIFDGNQIRKWIVKGEYCQSGNIFRQFGCKSCSQAKYEIFDQNMVHQSQIIKKSKGCCKSCNDDQDQTAIVFPQKSDYNDRILMMMAGLFLEYRYFEDNSICNTTNNYSKIY